MIAAGFRLATAAAAMIVALAAAHAADRPKPLHVMGISPVGDFSGHIRSMAEMRFTGVVKQRYDFSCGSAALATLLEAYGDNQGEAETFRGMWKGGNHDQIRKLGFSLLDMKRFLASRKLQANGYKVSLAAVEKAGVPGIALVTIKGYRHFVVLQGVRSGEVLIADPALGLRTESAEAFEKSWNGILFVIDTDVVKARATFNAPTRWAAYVRAPLGSRFSDPLSLQALTLTAPFYREF